MTEVITRFPPSPTGNLHIGNIRTLLFNYLYTRHHQGKIVMRFEDTDTQRSSTQHEAVALETLAALGLEYDDGPYRQSQRTERYVRVLNDLIEKDLAYVAEASEEMPGEHVIRFRNPNQKITFTDLVRGEITIDTTDFGDFVIARSRNNPVYHLSVVVDDVDMHVTHIIRGEDHITSTPRQILLIDAIGGKRPYYAHLPLIVGSDRKKLGKRHGATTYQEFVDLGVLPEALINYLALLGWNPGDDREIFSKEELIKEFTLERVNNSPATFSYEKLASINKHYLQKLPMETYVQKARNVINSEELLAHPRLDEAIELVLHERVSLLSEIPQLIEQGELRWLITESPPRSEDLHYKDAPTAAIVAHLENLLAILSGASVQWSVDSLRELIWSYIHGAGEHSSIVGQTLSPLRVALTGAKQSPDPFTVAYLIGREATLARLRYALEVLQ